MSAALPFIAFGADACVSTGARSRTLVLGLGETAGSIARWLAHRGESAMFVDSRPDANADAVTQSLPDACVMRGFDAVDVKAFDQVIASPGIPDSAPLLIEARAAGVPVMSDIALFCRETIAPIVCVTGTNGKSTVVSLLQAMCQQAGVVSAAGGNLGPPALDLPMLDSEGVYILELSSFQLQRTDNLVAHSACVLNVAPDHLDWHGTFGHYRDAKARIYQQAAYSIVNLDAELDMPIDVDSHCIRYSVNAPARSDDFGIGMHNGERWFMFGQSPLMPVADSAIIGLHNHSNVLAALALGSSIDLPMSAMLVAIREWGGLAHRRQLVATIDGVRWINDSKATNSAATLASVSAEQAPTVLLLGGRGKGEDLDALARALPDHVLACVVYGENAAELSAALQSAGKKYHTTSDLHGAVVAARDIAEKGGAVLLAPAAASQDQFANYAERGSHFNVLVAELSS